MISFRKRLHSAHHLVLACIAALLWIQFSGVHLHSELDGHGGHIHAAQSPHHAVDGLHDEIGIDIDVMPAAASLPQIKHLLDLLAVATVALLLFVFAPQRTSPARPAPERVPHLRRCHTSPPLRAPPVRS